MDDTIRPGGRGREKQGTTAWHRTSDIMGFEGKGAAEQILTWKN